MTLAKTNPDLLPALPFDSWKDTLATLHMWTQVVGKLRLKLCPLVNHFWNVTFYLTARGLFLKETGRKLAHVERQLRTGDTILRDLSERLAEED